MGQTIAPERSWRIRKKLVSYKQLKRDVKRANRRLAPFFVDPERRVGMRFDIYSRISDEIVNSFWRFRNNIIVQVTLTKPVGKKVPVNRSFVLTVFEFYYLYLYMSDNLSAIVATLPETSKNEAKTPAKSNLPTLHFNHQTYRRIEPELSSPHPNRDKKTHTDSKARPSTSRKPKPGRSTCHSEIVGVASPVVQMLLNGISIDYSSEGFDEKGKKPTGTGPKPKDMASFEMEPSTYHHKSSELCAICYDNPSDTLLNCLHAFCEDCIEDWGVKSSTCPVCRQDLKDTKKSSNWVLTSGSDKEFRQMAKETIRFAFDYVTKKPKASSS
ncbi:hypothetical protein AAMO2058_001414600 [Amorphochlora amoebiformis]|uniref:RING finger protein 141 n=1 Tax=Amorphochlora amoebiformis TaxID=1561963 RepID=A0A7S0CPW0_9EUKA|mmetsp:Transcript_11439/g.18067  ORF Transcript_11439/g.18067 Transcript_11439/m.18067 type:complete len:327 (+) Transcript_11439:45-1025(+)